MTDDINSIVHLGSFTSVYTNQWLNGKAVLLCECTNSVEKKVKDAWEKYGFLQDVKATIDGVEYEIDGLLSHGLLDRCVAFLVYNGK